MNRVTVEDDTWWVSGDTNGDGGADFNFGVHTSAGLDLTAPEYGML